MPKSYSKFTFDALVAQFDIQIYNQILFDPQPTLAPSAHLLETLAMGYETALVSEKARSENIVNPILLEIKKHYNHSFSIFSGVRLNADAAQGLNGECDFIVAAKKSSYIIQAPILALVEAKNNDIEIGIPQCIAQMLGAEIYNQKQQKKAIIYGCVTTGEDWQFLKLQQNNHIIIDSKRYYLNKIEEILGALQSIINQNKTTAQ
jgi:hypothetical protein